MSNRIWIYQADRFLTASENDTLNTFMAQFVSNWQAHGVGLDASFEVRNSLFLIIKVKEEKQEATGCSIDASVHAVKEIQQQLGINFFNRQRVAYLSGQELKECSMAEFKSLAKSGAVNAQTKVFNNTITTIDEFDRNWETTAQSSWHKMLIAQ